MLIRVGYKTKDGKVQKEALFNLVQDVKEEVKHIKMGHSALAYKLNTKLQASVKESNAENVKYYIYSTDETKQVDISGNVIQGITDYLNNNAV